MTRRRAVGVLLGALGVAPAAAAAPSAEDIAFMRLALTEAGAADFPFGAVITQGSEVLARGRNSGSRLHDPTAHGEMMAIHAFLAQHGPERLRGTTLYTSGEPCPMCMGAILWCGISRMVYAASIPQLATRMSQIMVRSEEMAARSFAPIAITGGVLAEEAMALFGQHPTGKDER